jgi:long-chain acyl-CoA synthetase
VFLEIESFALRTALVDADGGSWSYGSLVSEADRLASFMEARSLVLILCRNDVPSVIFYVGAVRRRVVPLLTSANSNVDRIQALIAVYQPDFIWGPSNIVKSLATELGSITTRFGEYELLGLRRNTSAEAIGAELALLMSTSGSTGSPVFVRQSYENLVSNANSICESLHMREDDRAITTLPLHYTYGLSILNSHLQIGASVALTRLPITDRGFWDFLRVSSANNFGGVPYTYEMLRRFGFRFLRDTPIRYITQAGGKLRPEWVFEMGLACLEASKGFFVMYGQTEASPRMSVLPLADALRHPSSIGRAISGGSFWLEDGLGQRLSEPGVIGELIYSGPNVALGYASSRSDLARGDDFQGVLRTGDLASIDQDGLVTIAGRKKRFVKIFGNRINLEDVEISLRSKGIENACVGSDERITVYAEGDYRVEDIVKLVCDSSQTHRSAVRVVVSTTLPRAESGKIMYSKLDV